MRTPTKRTPKLQKQPNSTTGSDYRDTHKHVETAMRDYEVMFNTIKPHQGFRYPNTEVIGLNTISVKACGIRLLNNEASRPSGVYALNHE